MGQDRTNGSGLATPSSRLGAAPARAGVLELIGTRWERLARGTLPPVIVISRAKLQDHPRAVRESPAITILPESWKPSGMQDAEAEEYVSLIVPDVFVPTVLDAVARNPDACSVIVDLVRSTEYLPTDRALTMESMAYSLLQAGPEYTAWHQGRKRTPAPEGQEPQVVLGHDGVNTTVELNRPNHANALGVAMRHELVQVFSALGTSRDPIRWSGRGRHFCAGGDLADFGPVEDPVWTHRLRTVQALPRDVAAVADRLTVKAQGCSVGAGVELLAFARRVEAAPDATFRLPEASMGLLPGCGGTVSVPRRIGRSRALLMMLTGMTVDAALAQRWGLVDEVLP